MLSSGRAARRSVTRSTPTGSVNPNGLPTPSYNCWWSSGVVSARREARAFGFVFKKCVKGQMIEVTFTAKSVERKLAQLKKVLKEEHYAFPAHTPPDEVALMFPLASLHTSSPVAEATPRPGRRKAMLRWRRV